MDNKFFEDYTMIVAYSRVSSVQQNLDRQTSAFEKYAVEKFFEDKCSGKNTDRPQLQAMLEFVREGDTVLVFSLDRLARNLTDLLSIVQKLNDKGVSINFLKENLRFEPNAEASAMNTLTLQIFGAFAQWERAIIRERQMQGIAIAKAKGVYANRKHRVPEEKYAEIDRIVSDEGLSLVQACKKVGVSRAMYYVHLKQQKQNASKEAQNEKA
jgi:DNA invertase Pin-like site-specific DNA recombinase